MEWAYSGFEHRVSNITRERLSFDWTEAFHDTVVDLVQALKRFRFALMLAWREISSSVRLTLVGPAWLLFQPLLWIVTIVFVFGPSAGRDEPLYGLYVAIGLTLYLGLQTCVVEGARVFIAERSIILNVSVPYMVFVLKLLLKVAISMAISSIIVVAASMIYPPPLGGSLLLVIPGMLIFAVACTGMILTIGVVGTKYIDLQFALQALMRVVMFATPIFWIVPEGDTVRALVAHLNPFYHLVEIIRAPVMGRPVALEHWFAASAFAVVSLVVGVLLFMRFRRRIALWI